MGQKNEPIIEVKGLAIGNNSVFLDAESRTMIAAGDPKVLLAECEHPTVHRFLTRGEA